MDTTAEGLDGWTPVCPSADLDRPRAAVVDGRAVVVWRTSAGRAVALDEACPHQGNRLSDGTVIGSALRCMAHGWEVASDGWCDRAGIGVARHDVLERDNGVWVRVRGPHRT